MNPRTGDPVLSMRDVLVKQVKGRIPKTLFLAGRCGVHEAVETSSPPKKDVGDYGDTPSDFHFVFEGFTNSFKKCFL
jgi:hypothetical protein